MRSSGVWTFGVAVMLFVGSAMAEEAKPAPVPAAHRVKRRVEKHDTDRSKQVKGQSRVVLIPGVIVVGRPGRPLSVFESATKHFEFPVGTARYSPADQRFLRFKTEDRW